MKTALLISEGLVSYCMDVQHKILILFKVFDGISDVSTNLCWKNSVQLRGWCWWPYFNLVAIQLL